MFVLTLESLLLLFLLFCFRQWTACDLRISDGSSDVCSADLPAMGYRAARELTALGLPLDAMAVLMGSGDEVLCPTWTALYVRLAGSAAAVERRWAEGREGNACVSTVTDRMVPYHVLK